MGSNSVIMNIRTHMRANFGQKAKSKMLYTGRAAITKTDAILK